MDESPTPSEQSSKASKDSFVMIPRSQLEAWIEELASLREGLQGEAAGKLSGDQVWCLSSLTMH